MNTEFILFFLKQVGWFLLLLLGIAGVLLLVAIFLVSLFLFLPFRYRMKLQYENEKFYMDGRLSFFFGFLSVSSSYRDSLFYAVKVGFFSVFSNQKKKNKKNKKNKKRKKEKKGKDQPKDEKKKIVSEVEKKSEEESSTEVSKSEQPLLSSESMKVCEQEEKERQVEKQEKEPEKEGELEEKDISDRLEEISDKIQTFTEKASSKQEKIMNTFEEVNKKKDAILDFVNSEGTIEGVKLLFTESFRFLKAIFPQKIKGKLRFGTGDVYTEGQYLTYLCLIYGVYAEHLEIIPEWEEEVVEVDLLLQGKIRLFTLLRICIKVYFSTSFEKLRNNIDFVKTRLSL